VKEKVDHSSAEYDAEKTNEEERDKRAEAKKKLSVGGRKVLRLLRGGERMQSPGARGSKKGLESGSFQKEEGLLVRGGGAKGGFCELKRQVLI